MHTFPASLMLIFSARLIFWVDWAECPGVLSATGTRGQKCPKIWAKFFSENAQNYHQFIVCENQSTFSMKTEWLHKELSS